MAHRHDCLEVSAIERFEPLPDEIGSFAHFGFNLLPQGYGPNQALPIDRTVDF
jgi:hypothetical protein